MAAIKAARRETKDKRADARLKALELRAEGMELSDSGIPVCLWCGRAADWGILFSCHALLQYCVYESVSAGIIQTISAGHHSDVLRWSCMAQIGNTGSA